jgi:hypothetical protein
MSDFFPGFGFPPVGGATNLPAKTPLKLSTRTLSHAIEEALMGGYTRVQLEAVLAEELHL